MRIQLTTGLNRKDKMKNIHYLVVPVIVAILGIKNQMDWTAIQWLVALSMAVIIRIPWVNTKLRTLLTDRPLPILHMHTFIIAVLFDYHLIWATVWYMVLNLSAIALNQVDQDKKQRISVVITVVAILINVFIMKPPSTFEWLVPLLFVNNVLIKKSDFTTQTV